MLWLRGQWLQLLLQRLWRQQLLLLLPRGHLQ
jgi:hypothetical protein